MFTYLPTIPTFTLRDSDSTRATSVSHSEMSMGCEDSSMPRVRQT